MSIDRCHSCNTPVDTDKSDDCYDQKGKCSCKRCQSIEIISKHSTQVGGVKVNFTVGRVN